MIGAERTINVFVIFPFIMSGLLFFDICIILVLAEYINSYGVFI